jgi:hypothetical protein
MERREQDHLVDATKMACPHCGLPADRNQNGIQGYRCGSSFEATFKPQWARSMTCLELHNGQLQEMFRKANLHALDLADRIKRLEEAGDAMAQDHNPFTFIDWQRAKEAKP